MRQKGANLESLEVEAPTLEEARMQANQGLPEGCGIAEEEVISEGESGVVEGIAPALEAAAQAARAKLPDGAGIVTKSTKHDPKQSELRIEADDGAAARRIAQSKIGETARIENVDLARQGRRGFIGWGKTPNTYLATVTQPAVVEISFSSKVRVRVGYRKPLRSREEVSKALLELWDKTRQLYETTEPLNTMISATQAEQVATLPILQKCINYLPEATDTYNSLLADLRGLMSRDSAIHDLQLQTTSFDTEQHSWVWMVGSTRSHFDSLLQVMGKVVMLMEQEKP